MEKDTTEKIMDLYIKRIMSISVEKFILNEIFEKYIMPELGYSDKTDYIVPLKNHGGYYIRSIDDFEEKVGLLICENEISIIEENILLQILEDIGAEWGYITNGSDIVLMNQYIKANKIEKWKISKKVLSVKIGKKIDMDYLNFYAKQELFEDKNVYYFKDIAEYKNTQYRGGEDGWSAYYSTLKRFFKHYLMEHKSSRYNGYEKFTFVDFSNFIEEQKVKSPYTIENMYTHISVYLRDKIGKKINGFQMSRKDVLKTFAEVKKEQLGDILDIRRIARIEEFLSRKQTYRIRNMTIFYLSIYYGIERRQICQLKWCDINFDRNTIVLDKLEKKMPKLLVQLLHELEIENIEKGYPKEYVFYAKRNNRYYPITRDIINKMFSSLTDIDPFDEVYTQYSPAKIRKTLAGICIKEASLEEVMFWLSIEPENLSRYLSAEEIFDAGKEKLVLREKEGKKLHPMEEIMDEIL